MRSLYRSLMKWPLCFLAWALLGAGAYFVLQATGQKSWIAVAAAAAGALILTIVWYVLLKKEGGSGDRAAEHRDRAVAGR